jgi:hypothetical protein
MRMRGFWGVVRRKVWREGQRCQRGEVYTGILGRVVIRACIGVYWRSWVGRNFCSQYYVLCVMFVRGKKLQHNIYSRWK